MKKGSVKSSRGVGMISSFRLKTICGLEVIPILSLYYFQKREAFSAWSVIVLPFSPMIWAIAFLLKLSVAIEWKKIVFSSPNLTILLVNYCIQQIYWYFRSLLNCSIIINLKFSSGTKRSLSFSRSSRKERTILNYWSNEPNLINFCPKL